MMISLFNIYLDCLRTQNDPVTLLYQLKRLAWTEYLNYPFMAKRNLILKVSLVIFTHMLLLSNFHLFIFEIAETMLYGVMNMAFRLLSHNP